MDAVVVARTQVQGGELTVVNLRSQGRIAAYQGPARIVVALGLENLITLDRATLADGSVHRTDEGTLCNGTGTGFQGACEKRIEAGVGRGIGLGCL